MKKYILVGLSTISVSLVGMEKSDELMQNDITTWAITPLGGYIVLQQYLQEMLCQLYNVDEKDKVEKAIHFTPVDCNKKDHPVYQYLKGRTGAIPLNMFTKGKSYTSKTNTNIPFIIVSDNTYYEKNFDSFKDYWHNIHNKKYSYDEYLKKIRSDQ